MQFSMCVRNEEERIKKTHKLCVTTSTLNKSYTLARQRRVVLDNISFGQGDFMTWKRVSLLERIAEHHARRYEDLEVEKFGSCDILSCPLFKKGLQHRTSKTRHVMMGRFPQEASSIPTKAGPVSNLMASSVLSWCVLNRSFGRSSSKMHERQLYHNSRFS